MLSGWDFAGFCQLSTQGVRRSNCCCLWVIAVARMCLIWRQHWQQFAFSWDLLVQGWEEQLVQKVHNPCRSNRWSEGRRKKEGGSGVCETTQRWRAAADQCGRHYKKKKKNAWPLGFYWQFLMFSLLVASLWFSSNANLFEACSLLEVKPNL